MQLEFKLQELDLYMLLDTEVSAEATLTIPLYVSQTPVGISLGPDLEVGVFVTLDLILSVGGAVSLRSGFHLRVDETMGFKLALFSRDVSDVYLCVPLSSSKALTNWLQQRRQIRVPSRNHPLRHRRFACRAPRRHARRLLPWPA